MSFGYLLFFLIYLSYCNILLRVASLILVSQFFNHFCIPFNLYSFINLLQSGNWQSAGIEFPPRDVNSVPLFTPPQTQPVVPPELAYDDAAIQASLQSDASDLRYCLKNIRRPIFLASLFIHCS